MKKYNDYLTMYVMRNKILWHSFRQ